MALLGTLVVKLNAQTAKFQQGLKKAGDQLKGFQDRATKVAAVSGAAFAGLAAGITLAVKASSEQRAAELKLEAAARASREAIDVERMKEFAAALQDTTGAADEATIAQSAFLTALGLQQEQVEGAILAMQDFGNVTGKRGPRLMRSFASALEGTASTLASMGLVLSETEKDAFNAAERFGKAQIIIEAMGRAAPGLTEALKGTAVGGFQALTGRVGDFLEQIGFIFDLPLGGLFNKLEMAVKGVTESIAGLDKETKEWLLRGTAMGAAILGVSAAVGGLVAVLPFLIGLISAVAVPMLVAAGVIVGLIFHIGLLRRAWEENWLDIRGNVELAGSIIDTVVSALADALNFIVKRVQLLIGFFAELPQAIKDVGISAGALQVAGARAAAGAAAAPVATEVIVEGARELVSGTGELSKKVIGEFGNTLKAGLDPILKGLGIDVKGAGKLLDFFGKQAGDAGREANELAKESLNAAKGTKKAADEMKVLTEATGQVAQEVPGLLETLEASVVRGLSALFETIAPIVGDKAAGAISGALLGAFKIVGQAIQGGGENINAALQGAAEGFQTGGVIGAVIGAVVALLTQTQAFKDILQIGNESLGVVVKVLNKFLKPFVPIIEAMTELGELILLMSLEIGSISSILTVLNKVMEQVTEVIRFVAEAIRNAFNAVVDAIANVIEKIPGFGKDLARRFRKSRIETEELTDFLAEEQEKVQAPFKDIRDELRDTRESMEDFNDASQKISESLANVPTGFKVALRRFEAISPELGAPVPGTAAATAERAKPTINIERLQVDTTDPQEFLGAMRRVEEFERFALTGSALLATGAPFSVDVKGA